MSILESYLAAANANIALREFSFARNEFEPAAGEGKELADHVVWIEDLLLTFQLKERAACTSDPEAEIRWLKKKVLTKATKQVRDTLAYLETYSKIRIQNQRGHRFVLEPDRLTTVRNVVVWANPYLERGSVATAQFHLSRTTGFIHVMSALDYTQVCQTLLTPFEILAFLDFRQHVLERLLEDSPRISDAAILGQFLSGKWERAPRERDRNYLARFKNNTEFRGVVELLGQMQEHLEDPQNRDYYTILREFAKLDRHGLSEVQKRLGWCLEWCRQENSGPPTRFQCGRTQCVFMIVATPRHLLAVRTNGLLNFTMAAKYSLQAERAVGVSVLWDGSEVLIDWCYLEGPWERDAEMDQRLAESDLFPPVRKRELGRYEFE